MAEGVPRKLHFVPLENNPDVMTTLVHKLGLSKELAWHDVFSLDDPSALSFIPRPAHALLLVFPTSDAYATFRAEEDSKLEEYSGSGPSEEVLWFRQTIGNACGLMGLLHAACNGMSREFVVAARLTWLPWNSSGDPLAHLIDQATPLNPTERAKLLETSPDLAQAHASAAAQGDTAAPAAEDSVDLHYVAFVKAADNSVWELDGSRKGPLNRGKLHEGDDILSLQSLEIGPKRFLQREAAAGGGDLRFSVLALGPSFD